MDTLGKIAPYQNQTSNRTLTWRILRLLSVASTNTLRNALKLEETQILWSKYLPIALAISTFRNPPLKYPRTLQDTL